MKSVKFILFNILIFCNNKNIFGSNITTDIKVDTNSEQNFTTPEFVIKYGYPAEIHNVETEDGYILEIHRIPYGKDSGPGENKPMVFLQHGFISSSTDFVLAGPKNGLAYLLADRGYDVWMGNARGNTYSRKHKDLNPDDAKFWDFSWHEIGIYDIPAMIDYALVKSGQNKTFYIGHSQGTTVFYVMCSMKPEYNDKIRVMISMAPTAYMSNMVSPLFKFFARYYREITIIFQTTRQFEFMPANSTSAKNMEKFCQQSDITQFLCTNFFYLLFGFNEKEQDKTLLPVILSHTPAGSSIKQVVHYLQEINSGQFCQFDNGLIRNILMYQNIFPPKYDLSKVYAPVALFYSRNDWMAAEIDVLRLYQELGHPIDLNLITDKEFNHLDFLWAKNVYKLVYKNIFKTLEKY